MTNRRLVRLLFYTICIVFDFTLISQGAAAAEHDSLLTGKAAMGDWTSDAPGMRRKITIEDLPAPISPFMALNFPRVVDQSVIALGECAAIT